jgi:orotidine-5'-phosphate decarboxylase
MQNISNKLIVALDVNTCGEAKRFVDRLFPKVKIFKLGPVLFTADGPKVAELIRKKGAEIFLDLKYHDIPNTVANAVRQAVRLKVKMLTLHISGGQEMLRFAAEAAKEESFKLKTKKPLLLGITVLTSDKESANTQKIVLERAGLAKRAGLDGIVCSVREAAAVRRACGRDFVIVTPGIRPKGKDVNDQKRVASAKDAISAGANYIVVGRPILEAKDPLEAAKNIIKELE